MILKRYFTVAAGSKVADLIQGWIDRQESFRIAANELAAEIGADDVYRYEHVSGPRIAAFKFNEQTSVPDGLRPSNRPNFPSGCYEPNHRLRAGRDLMRKMESIAYRDQTVADICQEIGLPARHEVIDGGRAYFMSFGRYRDTVNGFTDIVCIPVNDAHPFHGHESLTEITAGQLQSIMDGEQKAA